MKKDYFIGLGIGMLAGAVIGGSMALLYAPKSGKETRQLIMDKATDVVDTVKEKTSGVIDTVREGVSEVGRRGQAAVHAIRN